MGRCLLLHGAASRPEFIHRAFGPTLARAGWRLAAPDVRGTGIQDIIRLLQDQAADTDIVGGVSLGAHAAAAFAARTGWEGALVAVMPAWTGPPGAVASLTGHTAQQIATEGVGAVLDRISSQTGPDDWVTQELQRAWTATEPDDLARYLRVAAVQPAPDTEELRAIRAHTLVVALADDPLHPEQVARQWVDVIPGSTLEVLPRRLRTADELARPLARLLGATGSR